MLNLRMTMPFEIIFSINTKTTDQFVLDLQVAEKNGYSFTPLPKQETLTKQKLLSLTTAKDQPLIEFLIKEELAFIKKATGRNFEDPKTPFNCIHVSFAAVEQAFKLLAIAGKLFLNKKQLVIDLYGKSEFYYIVDSGSSPVKVEGRIKSGTQDFPLVDCDYIGRGPPHWFIKGISLKFISSNASWSDIQCLINKEPIDYLQLIKEAEEDPEAPRVILKGEVTTAELEPLPLLVLKDRHGSFADLFMVYNIPTTHTFVEVDFSDPRDKITFEGRSFGARNRKAEQGWEKDLLETAFKKKPATNSAYYCPLDQVAKSLAFLAEIGWNIRDSFGNKVLLHSSTELLATSDAQSIKIKGKVHFNDFSCNPADVIGAFNRRERFLALSSGYSALIPDSPAQLNLENLQEEGEIIGDEIRIKNNRFGVLADYFDNHSILTDSSIENLKNSLSNFAGIETIAPGASFKGTLRPYQAEGLHWLSFLYNYQFNGILADDMGLGKTVQVLAFLSTLEGKVEKPILVVAPTSLLFNWKKEIERFLPSAVITLYHGEHKDSSILKHQKQNLHIILTTYTTARTELQTLGSIPFECVILDEAQAIKNANTQTSAALCKYQSRFRLSITGTPIENHLMELWSHFRFLNPDLLGSETTFQGEVQAGLMDSRYIKRIKKKIKPFILRRRKEEVAKDLPEKIEQVVWVEMESPQRAIYEDFIAKVKGNLLSKVQMDGVKKHRMEILEAIMRLRQICCDPLLVSHINNSEETAGSAKLQALLQDINTVVEEGAKVLVYSQFTSMLSIIAKQLQKDNIPFVYLDGATKDRQAVVDKFQSDPQLPVFLISLKAGGFGLNLTAADYVFLFDPWWNEAVERQAIDRAHRIGRTDRVIAKRFIVNGSIEEKMMKLKDAKSKLAADLFDPESFADQLITMDDLLYIFN